MEPLRVFIGYDSKEPTAYHVLAHSILTRASCPVSITPLRQDTLRAARIYTRPRGPTESTEFSLTRFLVPALSGYSGRSVFMDCDMLCRADLAELWGIIEGMDEAAMMVCQHDYTPKDTTKFLGNAQTVYPRKNWSSLMVFNNERCRQLTPEYVNAATGLELHRFQWLRDEQIGALALEWNWLVGEYPPNPQAKILHWTLGGPWFMEYQHADHASEWFEERDAAIGMVATPLSDNRVHRGVKATAPPRNSAGTLPGADRLA